MSRWRAPESQREVIEALLSDATELNEKLRQTSLTLDLYTRLLVEAGETDVPEPPG